LLIALGLGGAFDHSAVHALPALSDLLHTHLRELQQANATGGGRVAGNVLHALEVVSDFYAQRSYRLAWATQTGPLPHADILMEALHGVVDDGLEPQHLHLATLDALLTGLRQLQQTSAPLKPVMLVELDLLLSDAFIAYTSRFTGKSVPQQTLPLRRVSVQDPPDMGQLLQQAIEGQRLAVTLRQFYPAQSAYTRLRQALRWYRQIAAAGGWLQIPAGPTLQQGDRDERVRALRARLLVSRDLVPSFFHSPRLDDALHADETDMVFDEALERAVRAFQHRHGLHVDGKVGRDTLAALNVPVQERIRRIVVNLERWRHQQLPADDRYIEVNVPGFTLNVMERDHVQLSMRVIVGKEDQQTPLFQSTITHVILSPYWQVPSRIAKEEILPRLRHDPLYLRSQNMRVVRGWGAEAQIVDTADIDWTTVQAERFSYRFRQEPGPKNALGRVKFQFPNQFSVYMHDTPSRRLFAKPSRAFSHGCVRLERPIELATYLLQEQWTPERMRAAIARGEEQWVSLPRAIPVRTVYRTVWVDGDGSVHFRPDIYGYDTPTTPVLCDGSSVTCREVMRQESIGGKNA
jgi:murein L,D-transpeptidase YcbB/YkuD